MQSKVSIVALVVVGMFAYTSAQCQPKQPMANYVPDYLQGKFYLVSIEKAFSYQDKEDKCTTAEVDDPSLQTFPYVITYQDDNGSPQKIIASVDNISPPGSYNATIGDGTNFVFVVLGAIQDKVHVLYACNPRNNRVAVWIYYASRVQGLQQLDDDSRRYVLQTLANNNIPRNDLRDIDNSNCNNN